MGIRKWVMKRSDDRNNNQTPRSYKPSFEQLEGRLLLSASVEGTVWNDINANGIQDTGENGLIEWIVNLDNGLSTTTDENGHYRFDGLDAGTYTVSQVLPAGWVQTAPIDNTNLDYGGSTVFDSLSGGEVLVQKIETDDAGNTYIGGKFSGTVDLDPGSGVDLHTAAGFPNIFVIRFNPDGTRAWTATWRGANNDQLGGIAIDNAGNVYVTGTFSGSGVDMDPTEGVDLHSAAGWDDAFLTKINADGSYGYTYTFGGANARSVGSDVAVDADGNVYITGSFDFTVDFDPTASTDNRTSPGQTGYAPSAYLTRIDADGSYNWTKIMGAGEPGVTFPAGKAWGKSLVVDSTGIIYIGGEYESWIDFDLDSTHTNDIDLLDHEGDHDVFVARFDTLGNYQGVWKTAGSEHDRLYDLTLDANDNVYFAGSYSGSVNFDPTRSSEGSNTHFRTGKINGWFVTRMNADGSFGWSQVSNSDEEGTAMGIAVNGAGQVQVAVHQPNSGSSFGDARLISLGSQGQIEMDLRWQVADNDDYPEMWDVAIDKSGATLFGGHTSLTSSLNPSSASDFEFVVPGSVDGFFSRLEGIPSDVGVTLDTNEVAVGVNFGARPLDESTQRPVVQAFTVYNSGPGGTEVTDSSTVNVSITAMDVGGEIAGWMITETDTQPLADDPNWSATLPNTYTISGGEGTKTLYAWVKDNDGHVSVLNAESQKSIDVDLSAPVVDFDDALTSDPSPELNGTVDDPRATVRVRVDNNIYNAVNNGDGTWTLDSDEIAPWLSNDTYWVTVEATDVFGRTNTPPVNGHGQLTVEAKELSATLVAADSGTYWPGQSFSVQFDITESAGAQTGPFDIQVALSANKQWGGQNILLSTIHHPGLAGLQNQTLSFDVVIPTTVTGGNYYVGIKVDSGDAIPEGNENNNVDWSTTPMITLNEPDFVNPTLLDWRVLDDTGVDNQDRITRDPAPALSLIFSEAVYGDSADIVITSPSGQQIDPDSITGWGGQVISVRLGAQPEDGTYIATLRGTIRDQAGNALNGGVQQVLNFTLDRTAPTVTVDALTTDDTSPALSGTVSEEVSLVNVNIDGHDYTAEFDAATLTWTLPDNVIAPNLKHGFHNVRVSATDLAGNIGSDQTNDELTVLWDGYIETFPSSDLSSDNPLYYEWEFKSTNEGNIYLQDGFLRMHDEENNDTNSLNEAILTLDLRDLYNLRLSFDHVNTRDFFDPLPETFNGSMNGDGVSISVDGFRWVKLTDLDQDFTGRVLLLEDALIQAENLAGSTDRSRVQIKFQQYGPLGGFSRESAGGGREIDNIHIDYDVEPEIKVTGNDKEIFTGDASPSLKDGTDFGRVHQGTVTEVHQFTVFNTGYQPLDVSFVSVPVGFVLVEDLPQSIIAQQSATFSVALDSAVAGEKAGEIVIYSNDKNEAEFRFAVSGRVANLDVTLDPLVTNNSTPALTGTVNDPRAEITVRIAGKDYAAINREDGTWILEENILDSLPENHVFTVQVEAFNAQTNERKSVLFVDALTVDTVAPVVGFTDVTGTVAKWGEVVTTDTTPRLTGTIQNANDEIVDNNLTTILVYIDDIEYTAVNNGNGTWTLERGQITTPLTHGRHSVIVKAIDNAGNEATAETSLYVDRLPPNIKNWTVEGDSVGVFGDSTTYIRQPHITFEFTEPVILKLGSDPLDIFEVRDISNQVVPIVDVQAWDLETDQPVAWGGQTDTTLALRFFFGEDLVPELSSTRTFTVSINEQHIIDRFGDELASQSLSIYEFFIETVPPEATLETTISGDTSPALTGRVDDTRASITLFLDTTVKELTEITDSGGTIPEDSIIQVDPENAFGNDWNVPAGVIPELTVGVHDIVVLVTDVAGNQTAQDFQITIALLLEDFSTEVIQNDDGEDEVVDPLSDWQVVNEGDFGGFDWTVEGEILYQRGQSQSIESQPGQWVSNGFYPVWKPGFSRVNHEGTFVVYENGTEWTDVKIRATLRSSDPDDMGIMFRYQNPNNYYRFSMSKSEQFYRLVKVEHGRFTVLAEAKADYPLNEDLEVEIVADGSLIEIRLGEEGELVFDAVSDQTDPHLSGSIALYTRANGGASFDNIIVTGMNLDPETDNQKPIAQDQSYVGRHDQSITLDAQAHDPDQSPETLTYEWVVDAKVGSFDKGELDVANDLYISTIAQPTFIPNANLTGDQTVEIALTLRDGIEEVKVVHTVTVKDMRTTELLSDPFSDTQDSFEDGRSNGWTVVDEGDRGGDSQWDILDSSSVTQRSNIHSWPVSEAMRGTFIQYEAGSVWTDYRINLDMQWNDDDGMGVMFRVQDQDNFYRFDWNNQTGERRLIKVEDGVVTVLGQDDAEYQTDRRYIVEIEVLWNSLKVSINDDPIFEVTDDTFTIGSIGLYTWGNVGGTFEDLTVTNLEGVNIAPTIQGTGASPAVILDTEQSTLTVAVTDPDTAPGDLDYTWTVRDASDGFIVGDTNSVIFQPSNITSGGSKVVYIDVSVNDGSLAQGDVELHTIEVLVVDAGISASSDLEEDLDNWLTIDQGTQNEPSNWFINSGVLRQTSDIYSNDSVLSGTFAKYVHGDTLKDIGLELRLRSTDNDGLGVMFRVTDDGDDNYSYYRLNWNVQTEILQLELVEESDRTVLASASAPFDISHWYDIAIYAVGDRLTVFVDGQAVFDVTDSTLSAGTIALYSWNNDDVRFDDVRVRNLSN